MKPGGGSVWVLDDMVGELERQGRSPEDARSKVDEIAAGVRALTIDLFRVRHTSSLRPPSTMCVVRALHISQGCFYVRTHGHPAYSVSPC